MVFAAAICRPASIHAGLLQSLWLRWGNFGDRISSSVSLPNRGFSPIGGFLISRTSPSLLSCFWSTVPRPTSIHARTPNSEEDDKKSETYRSPKEERDKKVKFYDWLTSTLMYLAIFLFFCTICSCTVTRFNPHMVSQRTLSILANAEVVVSSIACMVVVIFCKTLDVYDRLVKSQPARVE